MGSDTEADTVEAPLKSRRRYQNWQQMVVTGRDDNQRIE